MGMRIYQNIEAMNAHRQLSVNESNLSKSIERLSSGLRINRAGDDAAGLAISEKMRGQIRGLKQATRNAQDGISLIQTAEGALTETHAILQRVRELAVQSSTDTNTDVDRGELQKEVNQLLEELDRIANTTQFNTKNLLDGSFDGKFHIGANEGQSISLAITDMRSTNIGEATGKGYSTVSSAAVTKTDFADTNSETFTVAVGGNDITVNLDQTYGDVAAVASAINSQLAGSGVTASLDDTDKLVFTSNSEFTIAPGTSIAAGAGAAAEVDVTTGALLSSLNVDPETATIGGILTQADADSAITAINNAIEKVSAERAKLGSYQNRLEHTIANLGTAAENLSAAESRIRDVDMAAEMMDFTKNQILQQAGVAMLAQANQAPQAVLQLLR